MKFDPNFILNGLNGNPLEGAEDDVHAGKLLANALFSSNGSQPIKHHDWAMKLYNKQFIEMEASDLNFITQFIIESKVITVAVKAPLLQYIEKLRSENVKA